MIKEWRQACTRTVPECSSALPGLHLFAWHWQCLGVFLGPPSHPASHTKARDHSTVMGRLLRACPCKAARLHSRLCAQRQVLCCLSSCGGRGACCRAQPPPRGCLHYPLHLKAKCQTFQRLLVFCACVAVLHSCLCARRQVLCSFLSRGGCSACCRAQPTPPPPPAVSITHYNCVLVVGVLCLFCAVCCTAACAFTVPSGHAACVESIVLYGKSPFQLSPVPATTVTRCDVGLSRDKNSSL